jgi:MraZ protein
LSFRGTFEHALDAKNRLTVPARFRPALAGGAVLARSHEVTPGSARCVSIWTPDGYDRFTARVLDGLNPLSPEARQLQRFFFNNSYDVELDSANRLVVPEQMRRYAGLSKDVVVAGSGECIELWDRTAYDGYQDELMTRIPDIATGLGNTA